jgi:hypothetical protein
MGCSLPLAFMDHFEKSLLDTPYYKSTRCLGYTDDKFVIWPHEPERLLEFNDVNSIRPATWFTMEMETNNTL